MYFDPEYLNLSAMHEWELYSRSLKTELRQCLDEGRDVSMYRTLCDAICGLPEGKAREELSNIFYEIMKDAPLRADYPYVEPDDLDAIRATRPEKRYTFTPPAHDEALKEIARAQLYWNLGRNPFCQSLMYGEGARYASQDANFPGEMCGELPVGIETRGDEDVPYWPGGNNATYKEVWLTPAGRFMAAAADLYQ